MNKIATLLCALLLSVVVGCVSVPRTPVHSSATAESDLSAEPASEEEATGTSEETPPERRSFTTLQLFGIGTIIVVSLFVAGIVLSD